MYKKLIVPLDGSETAEVALPFAEEEIGRTGAELILLSVREANDSRSEVMFQSYLEQIAENSRVNAEKYQPSPGGKAINVRCVLLKGTPAEKIISFTEKEGDCRIIMATHGQSGLGRRTLGSVADKVSRSVNVPITLIRARGAQPDVHERGFFNKILATLDGSKESELILPLVEELALSMKADVTLLQVLKSDIYVVANTLNIDSLKDSAEEYMKQVTGKLQEKGINTHYVLLETGGAVADEINNYTAKNYIDLVVMATHGRSGPSRWLLGSVANKVLNEGNTPIMLIRKSKAG